VGENGWAGGDILIAKLFPGRRTEFHRRRKVGSVARIWRDCPHLLEKKVTTFFQMRERRKRRGSRLAHKVGQVFHSRKGEGQTHIPERGGCRENFASLKGVAGGESDVFRDGEGGKNWDQLAARRGTRSVRSRKAHPASTPPRR